MHKSQLTHSGRGLRALQRCLEQARRRTARLPRPIPEQRRHDVPAHRCLGKSYPPTPTDTQTIVQLLEAKDPQLTNNIRNSTILVSSIRQLADSAPSPQNGARPGAHSDDDSEDDGMFEDGEGEIFGLAKRILELIDEDDGEGIKSESRQSGDESAGEQHEDHAALRASVHQALRGQ